MAGKLTGASGAVGYWGRSPHKRIESEQIPEKVRVLLQDKLIARGQRAFLWLPVAAGDPGVSACTCQKETNKANDRPCPECYGTGLLPGYRRFLHETVHFGASEVSTFTLATTQAVTRLKPHPIMLTTGATTGTITTPDKAYSNPNNDTWVVNMDSYNRESGNTVTAEFSTDSGGTFFDIADINGVEQPQGTGVIQFRITLTRAAAADRSPAFRIIRARHVNSADSNAVQVLNKRPSDYAVGEILVLRPWIVEQAMLDAARGLQRDWLADKSWTAPLDFFDTSITTDTSAAVVRDTEPGPHPFIEHTAGLKSGSRVVWTSFKFNEEFGRLTHQSFDERLSQLGEVYLNVF